MLNIRFENIELERIATDPKAKTKLSKAVIQSYRKKIQLIKNMKNEQDLYGFPGLRPHKLRGSRKGQNALWINNQFRLVYYIRKSGKQTVFVVKDLIDYHK